MHLKLINDLVVFNRCANQKSFVKAAISLGITPSAVGKIISKIESYYGVKLFHRNTRAIELTEHGEILLLHSERIIYEMESVVDAYQNLDSQISGRLKISIPNLEMAFTDVLTQFMSEYPNVKLDISFTDQYVDLIADKYDVVIRLGSLKDSDLIARKVRQFNMLVVCSPNYSFNYSELSSNKYLLYKYPNTGRIEEWSTYSNAISSDNSITLNSISSIKGLCLKAVGVAFLPSIAVEKELESKTLVNIPLDKYHKKDINILWAKNRKISLKQRAFIDFFIKNF